MSDKPRATGKTGTAAANGTALRRAGRPADAAIMTLLAERGAGRTICPSEAARVVAGLGGDWRAEMPAIHQAARELAKTAHIRLSWRGVTLAEPDGPYRIARA